MKKLAIAMAVLAVLGVCEVLPVTSNILNDTKIVQAQSFEIYEVIVDAAKVRVSPTTSSKALGQKSRGQQIYVVSNQNGWVKLKYATGNGGFAYMSSSLVRATGHYGYF